jgi:endonuclease III
MTLEQLLNRLEEFYGKPNPPLITDPFEMVVHRNAGYPQSDERCDKGFQSLKKEVGLTPERILSVSDAKLAAALKGSGMNPELRARRLKESAALVDRDFSGDLRAALKLPLAQARKVFKKFPTIGDSGADRILLFTKAAPTAAVPSNSVHVLARLGFAKESANYAAGYKSAQEASREVFPDSIPAQTRAYLLIKVHGETLCKNTNPRCPECPVSSYCAYFRKMESPGFPTRNPYFNPSTR